MAFGFNSSAITQALVEYAEEMEEVGVGTGVQYLKQLRDRALAQVTNNMGMQYVSTTVDGQTFNAEVQVKAADLLSSASDALRIVKGEEVKITHPTFCNIQH